MKYTIFDTIFFIFITLTSALRPYVTILQLIFLFSCFLFYQTIFLFIKINVSLNYCIISQVDLVETMNDNELKSYLENNLDDSKKTKVQKMKNKVRLWFLFHTIFLKKYYFIRGDKIFRKSVL